MSDRRVHRDLAGAVAWRQEVDWDRSVERATEDERPVVANLRALAGLFPPLAGRPAAAPETARQEPYAGRRLLGALLAVAGIEWALSLAALPWIWEAYQEAYGSGATYLAVILIGYAACAAPLLLGGRRDERAWLLGVHFALLASMPAAHMLPFLLWGAAPEGGVGYTIFVHPFVFRPALLWQFTRIFPRFHRRSRIDDLARRMVPAAAIAGGAAGVGFVLVHGLAQRGAVTPEAVLIYQDAVLAFLTLFDLAAIVTLAFRARGAAPDEFARVALFAGGFLTWAGGSASYDLVEALRPGPFLTNIEPTPVVLGLAGVRLGCIALMAYAVLAQGALNLRFAVRASYRRLLARRLPGLAASALAAALAWYVAGSPERPVGVLLADPWFWMLAAGVAAALAAAAGRRRLLGRLDAWVHPQSAEEERLRTAAHVALTAASDAAEVGAVVARFTQRGCGLPASLLVVPSLGGGSPDALASFVGATPATPPLAPDSAIAYVVEKTGRSMSVAPEAPRSAFSLLPKHDAKWVGALSAAVVVPVPGAHLATAGLVALGRREEDGRLPDPFDVRFVVLLASAAGLALERMREATASAGAAPDAAPARECPACGRIAAADAEARCCGALMTPAPVPVRLADSLRLERRIGAGGMGRVYRARDEALERPVAVKTLASPSADRLLRLRHEALVMARFSHPSVAQIHGLQTWRGRPLLVVEFLAGGTLADRLRGGPLPAGEAVAIATAVAGALEALHAEEYLHGDVKPSNIGFTYSGEPKLFDMGLARLGETDELPAGGTLSYLSPERLRGGAPGVADDIWALGVVLYEMLAGEHPFAAPDRAGLVAAIRSRRLAPLPPHGTRPEATSSPAFALAVRLLTAGPSARIAAADAFAGALRAL